MPVTRWVLLVGACRHRIDPPPVQVDSDTPPSATGDTGPEIYVRPSVPASVEFVGLPGLMVDMNVGLLPATTTEPSVLVLSGTSAYPQYPLTFFVPGDLPRGEHGLLDVWDGVSGFESNGYTHPAGDVNHDGVRDAWLGKQLFLGPLLGSTLSTERSQAFIDGDGWVVAGDFDADGDGVQDVLLSECCQTVVIRYGPFEGHLGSSLEGEIPPSEYTQLGTYDGCTGSGIEPAILPDHYGPGRPAVAVGTDWAHLCGPDTYVYELLQPRGRLVPFDEALARNDDLGYRVYYDAGDLDADGRRDILFSDDDTWSWIHAGPLVGDLWEDPISIDQIGPEEEGTVLRPVGDVNGDGVQELLAAWTLDNPGGKSMMLMFSPHAVPLDPSTGLELGQFLELGWDLGKLRGDLDGDGLADLLGTGRVAETDDPCCSEDPGRIRIWYATDLLAAWDAQRAARGL